LTSGDRQRAAPILAEESDDGLDWSVSNAEQRSRAAKRAAEIVESRKRRRTYFSASMFGEPAWDMLLVLFLAESSHVRANTTAVALAADVPLTTALRWMDYLESQQLIYRAGHMTDRRVSVVTLTDKGRQALELYLIETPH
jgi:DNA-binding MarR family transcriptional regulator